ncbi:PREDICTED: uncharacterized protein LOC108382449 [Rhagoletis zephyria]|uniref:uncharacterized protein LOC108382449 n=1 Tax=Rhagoletis zephyria TaxID=28612 RepID=UPI0008117033|nr:PREDICTED: uncharacterized protein LOC108382449 [Rhagoletis zephyria]
MKESVEGISASTFGLPISSVSKSIAEPERDESDLTEYLKEVEIEIHESQKSPLVTVDKPSPPSPPVNVAPEKRPTVTKPKASSDLLEAELKTQQALLETVTGAVTSLTEHHEEQKRHFREIERLKREEIDEMQRLKNEEIAQMRRHNDIMEHLLKMKINFIT